MASTSGSCAQANAGNVALSVPGLHLGNLGVAGRTALYPALSIGSAGVRTLLRTFPDPALLRRSRRQVLVVTDAPDERHRAFVDAASFVGCPTLVVRWSDAPVAHILQLTAGVDPTLVKVADPRDDASSESGEELRTGPLLVPARADLDRLLLAKFPSLRGDAGEDGATARSSSESWLTVIVEGAADLIRIGPALIRALSRSGAPPLLIVTTRPREVDVAMQGLGLAGRIVREHDTSWLDRLPHSRAVLVPHGTGHSASGPSLNGAIWALTALRAGVPVVSDANPLLDPVAGSFISDDWERGLSLYVKGSTWFRAADAAIGQRKAAGLEKAFSASAATCSHPWLQGGLRVRPSGSFKKPVLLTFLDLAQDLDVLLPILQALRQKERFQLRVCVTDWLQSEAPRTFTVLEREGFVPEVTSRKKAINAIAPSLQHVDAVLASSESNQGPHRAGHMLAKRAGRSGIPAFTVQHGFENIGLTYKDQLFGANVRFASRHVFVWFAAENLPAWVPPDTFSRIIPTGSPKTAPSGTAQPLPDLGSWSRKVALFENLHWHRFSESYKQRLFADLGMAARRFPDTLFLIKPHSAGRWLVRNPAIVPKLDNIRIVDPMQPDWQIFTAPSLIPHFDAVITTPSTVAVDAARAGRRVAVVGNDLDLPLYEPLPILTSFDDWCAFLDHLDAEASVAQNEIFLRRNFLPYAGQWKIADAIYAITMQQGA